MLSKAIIIGLLVAMLISLGSGLFHLIKTPNERDKGDKVVKALTWRVSIWVVLLVFIVAAIKLGWLQPSNSVHPASINKAQQQQQ